MLQNSNHPSNAFTVIITIAVALITALILINTIFVPAFSHEGLMRLSSLLSVALCFPIYYALNIRRAAMNARAEEADLSLTASEGLPDWGVMHTLTAEMPTSAAESRLTDWDAEVAEMMAELDAIVQKPISED
jgi:hypothetical protein